MTDHWPVVGRVTIARCVLDDVIAHAHETSPLECCGILVGAGEHVAASVRVRNIADDPVRRFLLDPRDHLSARRDVRTQGLSVIGFYHSHPSTDAYPSQTDVEEAAYPDAVTLIVSLQREPADAKVFRLRRGAGEEMTLVIE